MSKIIGVDTANIDNISGLGTGGGGGIATQTPTTDSGILYCPRNVGTYGPVSKAEFSSYSQNFHMEQLSTITGVVDMQYTYYTWWVLASNGNLYSGGHASPSYLGVSSTDANDAINNGGLKLTQTGVSSFAVNNGGAFCIKSGELYWTGYVGSYLNSTGTGAGTNSSNYSWTQVGSDTDWYDVAAYPSYPYQAIAIKGSSGSRYLYACGSNASYGTAQGTSSGTTTSWSRVKTTGGVDLSESFSKIAISYGSCLAVTDGGKLFSWGENQYGPLGIGSTTDQVYAKQVGTDTDWANCWVQRFGGFALKSDGSLYMSTSRSNWNIEPSTTKLFTQIGTDTDYEDIRVNYEDSGSNGYAIFAKKNGSWYVSQGTGYTDGWPGEGYKAATPTDTWVAINDYLLENTITGTIDYILPVESHLTQNTLGVMFAVS